MILMITRKECPFCGKSSQLESQATEKEFRKEKFPIREFFYKCESCGEEFTTTAIDEITVNQVYNQYREKYGILFPEELVNLRLKYNLSAQKISQVLGLGINSYSNYEKGEIPTIANSNLIRSARNPGVFLTYLTQATNVFTEKAFNELTRCIQSLIKEGDFVPVMKNLNWYIVPNKYTGYVVPNLAKISNLLLYIIKTCDPQFNDKLKLNKMLFYADFNHYKNTGRSITGLTYRAAPYGPVPTNYDYIFAYLTNEDRMIESEFKRSQNSGVVEFFQATKPYELSVFDGDEMETINQIINQLKNTPSWELVELSHKERAWKELNSSSGIVSYQEYGFDLGEMGES